MRFAYQWEMFIDGSSAHVRKVEAECNRESLRRGVSVYSPHQDLLSRRVIVFEVAKMLPVFSASFNILRHLPPDREVLLSWTHTGTSGKIICLGQRTNKQRLKASSKRYYLFSILSKALSLNSTNDTTLTGFCSAFLPSPSLFQFFICEINTISIPSCSYVSRIIRIFGFIVHILTIKSNTTGSNTLRAKVLGTNRVSIITGRARDNYSN